MRSIFSLAPGLLYVLTTHKNMRNRVKHPITQLRAQFIASRDFLKQNEHTHTHTPKKSDPHITPAINTPFARTRSHNRGQDDGGGGGAQDNHRAQLKLTDIPSRPLTALRPSAVAQKPGS